MSNIVISVVNLSKSYRLGQITGKTLGEDINRWWARLQKAPDPYLKIGQKAHHSYPGDYILALDNINFQVERGDVLGVVGRNGAGKSTILKILSRITSPTSGYVRIKGRTASLLEVGTGFHPDLTGRENIFLNGTILGMTRREIQSKFDDIVEFAEVETFIDTPVKRYSSGMYVRLAFSVAAHLDPDILLVDEVLAVGDADFQKKCLGKIGEVAQEGRTVLFVSHNMASVGSLCKSGLLIEHGKIQKSGPISEIISHYLSNHATNFNQNLQIEDAEKQGFKLILPERSPQFLCGENIDFRFDLICPRLIKNVSAGLILYDMFDNPIVGTSSKFQKIFGMGEEECWNIHCDLGPIPLNSGRYIVSVWFGSEYRDIARFTRAFYFDIHPSDPYGFGNRVPKSWGHFYWNTDWIIKPQPAMNENRE